jgi:valyl-tRNA synthetase
VQNSLLNFQFARAITVARDFFWDVLCDWYLELAKPRMNNNRQAAEARQVLAFVLDQSLRMLHPFVPYITEGLWKYLNEIAPQRGLPGVAGVGEDGKLDCGDALIAAKYPPVAGYPALIAAEVDAVFADLQTATRAVREIRQSRNVPPKQPLDVAIKVPAERVASLQHEAHVIQKLANVGELTIGAEVAKPNNAATLMIGDMQIFVANVIDDAAERARLEKELANFDKQIAGIEGKLGNEKFVSGAPADVVEKEKVRLADLRAKRETVVQAMAELG